MDKLIHELRSKYTNIDKNNVQSEEKIKIDLIIDVLLEKLGYNILKDDFKYESDSKGGRSDIIIPIGNEQFYIETKSGNHKIDYKDVIQILGYMNKPGMEWGLITNGVDYILINDRITPPQDINNNSLWHKVVFWFNIFQIRGKDFTNVNLFKYLSLENLFEKRNTNYFRDIAQFKAFSFSDNPKSWSVYRSTLYSFFNFYAEKGKYKYKLSALEEITVNDFKDFIQYKQEQHGNKRKIESKNTVANMYSHISSMLTSLNQNKYINSTRFENDRESTLLEFDLLNNKKIINFLDGDSISEIIDMYRERAHGERDLAAFLFCATLGVERSVLINLRWENVHFKEKESYIEVEGRKLIMSPLLEDCLKLHFANCKIEKNKMPYIFTTTFGGRFRKFIDTTVNQNFNKITDISCEIKWSYFSPQYVRLCLIEILFKANYSIDEIIFITGVDVKNIYRYITTEDIINRQADLKGKALKQKVLFDGILEKKLHE